MGRLKLWNHPWIITGIVFLILVMLLCVGCKSSHSTMHKQVDTSTKDSIVQTLHVEHGSRLTMSSITEALGVRQVTVEWLDTCGRVIVRMNMNEETNTKKQDNVSLQDTTKVSYSEIKVAKMDSKEITDTEKKTENKSVAWMRWAVYLVLAVFGAYFGYKLIKKHIK